MHIVFHKKPSSTSNVSFSTLVQNPIILATCMFVVVVLINVSIFVVFEVPFIRHYRCDLDRPAWWIALWPPNCRYIRTLLAAKFSTYDICALTSTLSASIVVCMIAFVLVSARIISGRPTIYIKNAIPFLLFVLGCGIYNYHLDIYSGHTLFGPSVHDTTLTIAIYIIVLMAGWFVVLGLFIDRLKSYVGHAKANR